MSRTRRSNRLLWAGFGGAAFATLHVWSAAFVPVSQSSAHTPAVATRGPWTGTTFDSISTGNEPSDQQRRKAQELAKKNDVEVPEAAWQLDLETEARSDAPRVVFGGDSIATESQLSAGANSIATARQLSLALELAKRVGVDVPDVVFRFQSACTQFIEDQQKKLVIEEQQKKLAPVSGPSEKQLQFAWQLAKARGVQVSTDALHCREACSQFIDDQKKLLDRFRPSEKQLQLAGELAEEAVVEVPTDALHCKKACSEFIEGLIERKKLMPSEWQVALATRLADLEGVAIPIAAYDDRRLMHEFINELQTKRAVV